MLKSAKIYVAGSNGMVGSAIVRTLEANGYSNIIVKSSKELDLKNKEIDTNASLKNKDIDKKAETAKYVANKRPKPTK